MPPVMISYLEKQAAPVKLIATKPAGDVKSGWWPF
jgi:hypothetical protein